MSRLGDAIGRLFTNDRELADRKYAGRESATARSRRADFKPGRNVADAARQGQAWEDAARRRERYGR
jgi:hypothetical protein